MVAAMANQKAGSGPYGPSERACRGAHAGYTRQPMKIGPEERGHCEDAMRDEFRMSAIASAICVCVAGKIKFERLSRSKSNQLGRQQDSRLLGPRDKAS
jgi:hypothetical protein